MWNLWNDFLFEKFFCDRGLDYWYFEIVNGILSVMFYKFGLIYVIVLGILGNFFEYRDKSFVFSVKMLEIYGYIVKGF